MRVRPAAAVTPDTVAAIAEKVRIRVLRWFASSGLVEADDVREMLPWQNSGFSLDASRHAHRYLECRRAGAPAAVL